MAQISVIRPPQLPQSDIYMDLDSTVTEDGTGMEGYTDVDQTDVYGVMLPIISLNGVVVGYRDLVRFELDMTGRMPSVYFKFTDRKNYFKKYVDAGNDNELRVQILPPVEDTYKKIDLTLFVDEITINGETIEGRAIYKLASFTSDQYEALGMLSTFELFDYVSLQTGLGFASNVTQTSDNRYMSCNYNSYKDLIDSEIEKSVSDLTQVYDWWIDGNNYLTLCNIRERVNSIDSDDDMKVWSSTNVDDFTRGNGKDTMEITCLLTNHPQMSTSDLFVFDKEIANTPVTHSNTKVVSSFYEEYQDYRSDYVGDGDIVRDEFMGMEYGGEIYGSYDYMFSGQARELFLSKMKSELVILKMKKPMLGLMRGQQLKFVWYSNDAQDTYNKQTFDAMAKGGADAVVMTDDQIMINYPELSWLNDFRIGSENADTWPMVLDMLYSGQYTVIGQYLIYENQSWYCEVHVTRPKERKPQIFPVLDPESGNPM